VTRKVTYILFTCLIALLAINIVPAKAIYITSISQNSSSIGKYQKFEVTFTISDNYIDPFDPCIIDIMVTFTTPDGNTIDVPAFFYKEYDENSSGKYVNERNACWKVRFAPYQIGNYAIDHITFIDYNGTSLAYPSISFSCVESSEKGIIRVSDKDPYYMRFDNNKSYIPIGHNVSWLNLNGTSQWKSYFTKMGNAGENWTRIWMCPFFQGTILEWNRNHWSGYYNGVGNLSMPIAWRLDRIIESCEQNDIKIQLTLQYHTQFISSSDSDWKDNPYNIANAATDGGFLSDPNQFFTDANAIRLTKNKYRYIVARWGYSPAIFAWELFNEVQVTDAWNNPSNVVAWHNTMASYIRGIDPFKHFVTTSSHSFGFENLWNLPDINVVEVHYYGQDTIHTLEQTALGLVDFNKPVIMAEFGLGSVNPPEINASALPEPYRTQIDEGLVLHNGIWSSFHVKSSGHLWWWDLYIDPCNLYGMFTPLSLYAADENLADYNLTWAQRAVAGNEAYYASPVLTDFYADSTQTVFTLNQNYFHGMEHLSKWLHGTCQEAHRSDPNFHLTMPVAGSLKIHVEVTADWCEQILKVLVNGSVVFSHTYPADSNNFTITVPLSAGQQTVQVKNDGNDWFLVSGYEFVPNNAALLDSIGLSNNQRAYIWIYDVNSQYGLINNGTFHNQPVIIKGLDDGSYLVEVYATRGAGGITNSGTANSVAGQLTYTLPDFSKDIAVKATRIVNLRDFAAFAAQWRQTGSNLNADLDHNGSVDLTDLSGLTSRWLFKYPANWPF